MNNDYHTPLVRFQTGVPTHYWEGVPAKEGVSPINIDMRALQRACVGFRSWFSDMYQLALSLPHVTASLSAASTARIVLKPEFINSWISF